VSSVSSLKGKRTLLDPYLETRTSQKGRRVVCQRSKSTIRGPLDKRERKPYPILVKT